MEDFSNVRSGSSAAQHYRLVSPTGEEYEVTGPVGATDDQVWQVFSQAYQPPAPKTPDERSAGQLLQDQARSTLKGVVTGLPKAAYGIGDALGETTGYALMGQPVEAGKRLWQLAKDAYHGVADPFEHAGQLAGEYFISEGSQPDGVMDPERLANTGEASGANLTGAALPKIAGRVSEGMPKTGMEYFDLAHEARKYTQQNPVVPALAKTELTKPLSVLQTVPTAAKSVGAKIAAPVLDVIANELFQRESLARQAEAALQPRPANPPNTVRAPRTVAPESTEVNWPPQQPAPEPMYRDPGLDVPFEPQIRAPRTVAPEPPPPHYGPTGLQDVGPDLPTPQPITPMDVQTLQQAIRPTGNAAQTWVVRNAERVFDVAPELKGVPPGEQFIRRAIDAYNRTDMEMHAAERSVPPGTTVPKYELAKDLQTIQADYASRNQMTYVNDIQKVLDKMDELTPNIPWDEFLALKSGVWKNGKMSRARGAFIKATSKISEPLAQANQNYSIMRRVLEFSKIDPLTRRPLVPPR